MRIRRAALAVILVVGVSTPGLAGPVAPRFEVEVYAQIAEPVGLTFDPDGILYVGNGANTGPVRRVGIGGSPIEDYGPPFPDPDAVTFDAGGGISGTPGSVLVSGSEFSGGIPISGYVAAVAPDESATTIYSTPPLTAPGVMVFDPGSRLLFPDFRRIFAGTADGVTELAFGPLTGLLAVDAASRIYHLHQNESETEYFIEIHSPNGTIVDDLFAVMPEDTDGGGVFGGLVFGPYDDVWKGHLFTVSRDSGRIYRIDSDGDVAVFAVGFDSPSGLRGLAFGPDRALYVSNQFTNLVYRISAAEPVPVDIDVRPPRAPNFINPRSCGKIPVAILSTDDFDASTVDPESARFGPDEAEPLFHMSVDVDGDQDMDLRLVFGTQATGIECGDRKAALTAETFVGDAITGRDQIETTGCKPPISQSERRR